MKIATRRVAACSVLFLGITVVGSGTDAWVLRFRTDILYGQAPCLSVGWRDEAIFHNVTSSDLTVRTLASTSGAAHPTGQIVIPAGRTASSLGDDNESHLGGDPFGFQLLVARMDIPEWFRTVESVPGLTARHPHGCEGLRVTPDEDLARPRRNLSSTTQLPSARSARARWPAAGPAGPASRSAEAAVAS